MIRKNNKEGFFCPLYLRAEHRQSIMRRDAFYLIAAICMVLALLSLNAVSGAEAGSPDLMSLISDEEDTLMSIPDLAFFLATHNFNAMPKDGYVEIIIGEMVYKAVPNGQRPGLADITILS
jgi:hypothetical protein